MQKTKIAWVKNPDGSQGLGEKARVDLLGLENVCLDCCDLVQYSDCEKCAVNQLKNKARIISTLS